MIMKIWHQNVYEIIRLIVKGTTENVKDSFLCTCTVIEITFFLGLTLEF
jgi:hypothetical protein